MAISTTAPASLVNKTSGREVTKRGPSGVAVRSAEYRLGRILRCEPWSCERCRASHAAGSPDGPVLAVSSWLDQGKIRWRRVLPPGHAARLGGSAAVRRLPA